MAYIRKTTDIHISVELSTFLSIFADQSSVARLLLKRRHPIENLVENSPNYLSISSVDSTKISYLTNDRIEKLSSKPDYFFWITNQRYMAKPGVLIKKIFKDINNSEIEKFSNLFISFSKKEKPNFRVVEGEEIRKWYLYDNYVENNSSLGCSCMRHESCNSFMRVYSDNPEVVKMLIMTSESGLLLGRALLWKATDGDKEISIMDRIYTANDYEYTNHFKKWAYDNGYLHKSHQKWNNTLHFVTKGGNEILLTLKVKLKNYSYERFPYLDTFKFLDNSGFLYNYKPRKDFVTFSTEDGIKRDEDFLCLDQIDNLFYKNGDVIYLDYLKKWVYRLNCNYSDLYDTYIHNDHSIYSEKLGYIFKEIPEMYKHIECQDFF